MLAAGLDPYETQSRVIGSPERNGCSAPTIATLNGFTVKKRFKMRLDRGVGFLQKKGTEKNK